jgi:hypothetical protein
MVEKFPPTKERAKENLRKVDTSFPSSHALPCLWLFLVTLGPMKLASKNDMMLSGIDRVAPTYAGLQ